MAQEWSIQSRSSACQGCSRTFAAGEECVSVLFRDPPGFARSDVCQDCWQGRPPDAEPAFSVWRSVFQPPPPPAEEALRKETAESLLRRLMEQDDATHIPVMYILALMLERKKILIEQDVTVDEDDTVRRIYEYRRTGEIFVITDPRLNLDSLENVQRQVVEMLGGDGTVGSQQPPASQGEGADAQDS